MSKPTLMGLLQAVWLVVRKLGAAARDLIPRVYAAAMVLLIGWLTYLAVSYLITSLAAGEGPPPQITALPKRLDRSIQTAARSQFRAVDAAEFPRSPLAHYHQLDNWIQPDRFNDCTRSGCHNPMPHAKRKEVRAFLNMHATSIHCGVCHFDIAESPRPLVWYDLASGRTTEKPAILEAYEMLTTESWMKRWDNPTEADQDRLVELLRDAARDANDLPALNRLATHFEAVRVESPSFERLLSEARESLPRHFRGEYGAKLAIREDKSGQPLLGHPNTASEVAEYLSRGPSMGDAERERLLKAVHPLRREEALNCTDCHRIEESLVDFAQVGYPEARADALVSVIVFRMVEHIAAGRAFHLPDVVSPAPVSPPVKRE